MIEAQLKVKDVMPVGEIWVSLFEVEEGINEEMPVPQHFTLYTESNPSWKAGDSLKLTISGPPKEPMEGTP